ncbi:BTB/POZ domain-containing protein [Aspergillus brunneoviolaceus CBS 621.78]|uniref:Uncharacterized protein n=1 Tax=Aspergillus brunneoviolaceus CBS 621.78 TaxID=1450534 RepID=A0ACD1G020_9EURO|nr:hypothetical protein BO95DRAFT_503900 [Aspergillus brunneoviolaceus CBS 621.78]RAH42613.1 hypothetical protein BO95DRAFT_503900 [Aspergillus brunneoviolaceus CBS 621.78]
MIIVTDDVNPSRFVTTYPHLAELVVSRSQLELSATSTPTRQHHHKPTTMNETPLLTDVSERAAYFLNPLFSDITLICDGQYFPAHRPIICPQSRYFARTIDQSRPYPEPRGRQTNRTRPILLQHTPPYLLIRVLEFLYKGDYTVSSATILNAIDSGLLRENTAVTRTPNTNIANAVDRDRLAIRYAACFHARVYAQAEYFVIESLQALAADRFSTALWSLRQDEDGLAAAMAEIYD